MHQVHCLDVRHVLDRCCGRDQQQVLQPGQAWEHAALEQEARKPLEADPGGGRVRHLVQRKLPPMRPVVRAHVAHDGVPRPIELGRRRRQRVRQLTHGRTRSKGGQPGRVYDGDATHVRALAVHDLGVGHKLRRLVQLSSRHERVGVHKDRAANGRVAGAVRDEVDARPSEAPVSALLQHPIRPRHGLPVDARHVVQKPRRQDLPQQCLLRARRRGQWAAGGHGGRRQRLLHVRAAIGHQRQLHAQLVRLAHRLGVQKVLPAEGVRGARRRGPLPHCVCEGAQHPQQRQRVAQVVAPRGVGLSGAVADLAATQSLFLVLRLC
mmetsp:Transcript_24998/g.80557  ORF Transcript_24998/g.80557 Transcript_24998/m.80557 type:complete len:322 (-) Transcript_24998:388-1353(-)